MKLEIAKIQDTKAKMYCDLARSVGSREHKLWDVQPEKERHFFCFLLFWKSFNCYNFGTTILIQVGFSAKCTSPNEDFNQIENWKCYMIDFRLIPLDHITNVGTPKSSVTFVFFQWAFKHVLDWFHPIGCITVTQCSMKTRKCNFWFWRFAPFGHDICKTFQKLWLSKLTSLCFMFLTGAV